MPKVRLQADGSSTPIEVQIEAIDTAHPDEYVARCGDARHEVEIIRKDEGGGWLRMHGQVIPFHAVRTEHGVEVWVRGRTYRLKLLERAARRATGSAVAARQEEIKAPMPGTILKINVKVGGAFEPHAPLIVMESMKMEMALTAPHAGRVKEILCKVGELVPMGQVLARLEERPMLPRRVKIVEVGPRDGLQNESNPVATDAKLSFIRALVAAGLKNIEATSFVHPKAVPQLADAAEVAAGLPSAPGTVFSALVPNERGLERALQTGIRRIAVFTAASETFTQKNIGMSVAESLKVFAALVGAPVPAGLSARGYVSTAFVCPFEGEIAKQKVRDVAVALLDIGVDEVAISDTIGAAAPSDVSEVLECVLERIAVDHVALHFHDTYGTALANVLAGLQLGVTTFDSSAGGLGGCPFAPGAAGNLATEDLVYMLDRMKIETGVSLEKTVAAADVIAAALGRELLSRQWRRLQMINRTSE